MRNIFLVGCAAVALALSAPLAAQAAVFDVKAFGAKADGKTLDRDAINKAIDAAVAAGGGTVFFPAGTYLTGSIRLRSNITLQFEHGTVIEATPDMTAYDAVEPNPWEQYDEFGHNHWHNSLIWGDEIENVSIVGDGLIIGKALRGRGAGDGGNKSLALRLCRNVTLRDFSILFGGHFGILMTGVDNVTVDNLKIDSNFDSMDVDNCRNVRISNCSVNSPNDDAIVLKAGHALGITRPTENVTITNVFVSGYEVGSLLDGTYKRTFKEANDREGPTGRIKIGTESEGDFKNITISNAVFDHCRGLAIESVDGSHIEDIAISNITMRDVANSPIFLRLGSRMRAPLRTPMGSLRRVSISNVVVYDADPRFASIITGIPGHDIEDIKLSNLRLVYRGGLTLDHAARQPADMASAFFATARRGIPVPPREPYEIPEQEKLYPEPAMFGVLPVYGFFIRHAKGIELNNVEVGFMQEERRPAFYLDQVVGADFNHVKAQRAAGVPTLVLRKVEDFAARDCTPLPDIKIPQVDRREM